MKKRKTASKKILTVAQIGCGQFARGNDLPNFAANPKTRVKWCCDALAESARAAAQEFGVPEVTTDFHAVLADPEVDMIKIATSHDVHLPIITAAAAAGKHIFCEKPMAFEEEEAYRIVRAVRSGGVKLCVDLNRRMSPSLQSLRARWLEHRTNPRHRPWRYTEMTREPLPEERQTQFLIRIQDESSSYRIVHLDPLKGGGLILGESVHWLDLACWFFAPDYPVEIQAFGSSRLSHVLNLRFSGGDTATIVFNCGGTFDYPKELYEVTHNGALFRNRFFVENEYFGCLGKERETFPLQNDPWPKMRSGFDGYMERYSLRVESLSNAKKGHFSLAVDKGHRAMLDQFVDAVLDDAVSPCDELAGLVSTCLARLAMRSIELRQALPVSLERIFPIFG
jgi:predicted dehydrogenase